MPFLIRPYRRFPMQCAVIYNAGLSQGKGIVWNLSCTGWRISGDVPLRVGQTCPLTVTLPNQENIVVARAIVRWVRGQEYGLETLVIDKEVHRRVEQVITQLGQNSVEIIE